MATLRAAAVEAFVRTNGDGSNGPSQSALAIFLLFVSAMPLIALAIIKFFEGHNLSEALDTADDYLLGFGFSTTILTAIISGERLKNGDLWLVGQAIVLLLFSALGYALYTLQIEAGHSPTIQYRVGVLVDFAIAIFVGYRFVKRAEK